MTDGKNDTPYKARKRTIEDEFQQLRDNLRKNPYFAHIDTDDEPGDTLPPESTRLESGQIIHHHRKADCSGNCCLHGTSEYESCKMPRAWRTDKGIIEHQCPHGVGHPCHAGIDYHNAFVVTAVVKHDYDWGIHDCCGEGCCSMILPPRDTDRLAAQMLQTAQNLTALIGVVESLQADSQRRDVTLAWLRRKTRELEKWDRGQGWAFLFLTACFVFAFALLGK